MIADLLRHKHDSSGVRTGVLSKVLPAYSIIFGIAAIFVVSLTVSIVRINQGTFTYTLDDPYIHLALSDQVRHGHYGISPGVASAPSSSILYPLLLTIASGTRLHLFFPLVINCFCLLITLAIMRQFFAGLLLSADTFGNVVEAFIVVLMALCFNVIGVVFTGLEHSLQIAMVAAIIWGIAILLDSGRLPYWLAPVIVAAPLVRYESLALCTGAILVLAIRGHWKIAAGAFAAIVFTLASFSLFLLHLGLPPLPNSVLLKLDSDATLGQVSRSGATVAAVGAHAGILVSAVRKVSGLIAHLNIMLYHPAGVVLFLILISAGVVLLQSPSAAQPLRWTSRRLMSLMLVCLIGGHAAIGKFGWFERYEPYVLLGSALIGCYLIQDSLRSALANKQQRGLLVSAAVLGLFGVGAKYTTATSDIPNGANNVFQQQFQMHRFVNDFYRGPVAVNDLGLVVYHDPYFVLDLFGLASQRARLLMNSSRSSADDYQKLVADSGVKFVMIYDDWFKGKIPTSWQKVGSLTLGGKRVSVSGGEVEFYATDDSTARKTRKELSEFQAGLPPGATMTIY